MVINVFFVLCETSFYCFFKKEEASAIQGLG